MGFLLKSQDILLLLKLVSISVAQKRLVASWNFQDEWQDWELARFAGEPLESEPRGARWLAEQLTVRRLADATGISKTQVSLSQRRSFENGLARIDRKTQLPTANLNALHEFIVHGARYVFPARKGTLERGITTCASAPVLQGQLLTATDSSFVWPDPLGKTTGIALEPIHHGVTTAVRQDPTLYGYLALLDSIRVGGVRERQLAAKFLAKQWGIG